MISTKICSKCKIEQPTSNFSKNRSKKDGLCNWCKECTKELHREHYKKNKKKINAKNNKYRLEHQDKIKKLQADWYQKNLEKMREAHRKYSREHKEERSAYAKKYNSRPETKELRKKYYQANKEHRREYAREYRKKNGESIRKRQREYYQNNKDKVKDYHKKYRDTHQKEIKERNLEYRNRNRSEINARAVNRLHNDPIHKMRERARNMVRSSLHSRGYRKKSHTADIVGCNLDFLCEYLFRTWEKNYGRPWNGEPYHIDHIIPLATARTKEDILKLCHYTNLQMLTPEDNMAKSDKV